MADRNFWLAAEEVPIPGPCRRRDESGVAPARAGSFPGTCIRNGCVLVQLREEGTGQSDEVDRILIDDSGRARGRPRKTRDAVEKTPTYATTSDRDGDNDERTPYYGPATGRPSGGHFHHH